MAGAGDPSDIEASWATIQEAMNDIHNKNCSKLAFEQLYRASYKIVLNKKGDVLYDRVCRHEEIHFETQVVPQIKKAVTANLVSVATGQTGASTNERRQMGEEFLRHVRQTWGDHNTSMNMVADILMYLDRGYTQDSRRPSIYTACIGLYRDHILRQVLNRNVDCTIFDIVNSVVLDLINMERDGDVIDHYTIRSSIDMLDCLYEDDNELDDQKLYNTVFEPAFLAATTTYYGDECQKLLRDADAGAWLRHTHRRLAEEFDRCETTIQRETRDQCIKIVEQQLISSHLEEFLTLEGSGLKAMLNYDRYQELTILYHLVSRVDPSKETLKRIMSSRIVELGLEIQDNIKNTDFSVNQPGRPTDGEEGTEGVGKAKTQGVPGLTPAAQQTAAAIKWVDDVLKLKDKYDKVWASCFNRDLVIQTAMTKSFSQFINMFAPASEYVSLFIDDNLRRGIRGKTESEVEEVLEKAVTLIRYLTDKDMFERYYQKHLAKRLLHSKSESYDVEKSMISRMKQELGNQFTSKFEGMFKDMQMSSELTSNYRDHMREVAGDDDDADDRKQPELSISVLTSNSWPPEVMGRSHQLAGSTQCNYPDEIQRLQDSLTKYYLSNRTGRKLNWVGTAGNADIKCVFPAIPGGKGPLVRQRRYELNVSTFGMVVLMLFNEAGDASLSFRDIQAETNIPEADLMRALTSLSLPPKSRILLKEPPGKRIELTDSFQFNAGFVSKTVRIKAPIVNATSKVEGDDERKQTEEKNKQERAHMTDAAIVRTMKYVTSDHVVPLYMSPQTRLTAQCAHANSHRRQRKELTHAQLVSEVVTQLIGRFNPEVALVKKRIEDLIVRDYLERVEEADTPTYRYLA